MMNKCILILVYFGEFKNYFPLFLKSCKKNEEFNWLIITDNKVKYDYPINCKVVNMDLKSFNKSS